MASTTNIGLPEISQSQANKYITHNEALWRLDALVQGHVIDRDIDDAPGSPSNGDSYIISSTPAAGGWVGASQYDIAYYQGGWYYATPQEGWELWVDDEDVKVQFNGSYWQIVRAAPSYKVQEVSSNTSVAIDQAGYIFAVDASAAVSMYLPKSSAVGEGFTVGIFKLKGGNNVTVDPAGSEQVVGAATQTLDQQWEMTMIVADGVSSWYPAGGGGAARASYYR